MFTEIHFLLSFFKEDKRSLCFLSYCTLGPNAGAALPDQPRDPA